MRYMALWCCIYNGRILPK